MPTIGQGYGIAKDVVYVDFDGTTIQWSPLHDTNPPLQPGVVEALQSLAAAGKRIVIFTSRMSQKWLQFEGLSAADQYSHIAAILTRHGIPFEDITAEKAPAEAYIDDMAIGFRGDWDAVLVELKVPTLATEFFMPRYWSGGNQRWHEVGDWSQVNYSAVPLCQLKLHTEPSSYGLRLSCDQRGGYCTHYLRVHETKKSITVPENLCKHCERARAKRAAARAAEESEAA